MSSAAAKSTIASATDLFHLSSVAQKFGGLVSQEPSVPSCFLLSFPASGKISQRFPSNPESGSLILMIELYAGNAAVAPTKCFWYKYKSLEVYLALDKKWYILSSQRTPTTAATRLTLEDLLRSLTKAIEGWTAYAENLELLLRWLVPYGEETRLMGGFVKISPTYHRLQLSEAKICVVLGRQTTTNLALWVSLQLHLHSDCDKPPIPTILAKLREIRVSETLSFEPNNQLELQFQEFESNSKVYQLVQYFADLKSRPWIHWNAIQKSETSQALHSCDKKEQKLRVAAASLPSSSKGKRQSADAPNFGIGKVRKISILRNQAVLHSLEAQKSVLDSAEPSVAATSKDTSEHSHSRASIIRHQHVKGKRESAGGQSFGNQIVLPSSKKRMFDSIPFPTSKHVSVHSYSRCASALCTIHQQQPKSQNAAVHYYVDLDQLLTSEELMLEVPYCLDQLKTFVGTWEPHGLVTEKSHGFCCWMYFSSSVGWNQVKISVGGPPPHVHVSAPYLANASFAAFRFQKSTNHFNKYGFYSCLIEARSKFDWIRMRWTENTFHESSSDLNWLLTEWAPGILSQMFSPRVKAVEEEETAADDAVAAGLRADWMMGPLETDDTKPDVKVEHDDQFS